jgi:hypothetical protein
VTPSMCKTELGLGEATVRGMDFAKADQVRRVLGLDALSVRFPENYDDAAFSRHVLNLSD